MQIGRRRYFGYTVARLPFLIARLTPMLEPSRKQMRVAQRGRHGRERKTLHTSSHKLNGKQSPVIRGAYFALLNQLVGADCNTP